MALGEHMADSGGLKIAAELAAQDAGSDRTKKKNSARGIQRAKSTFSAKDLPGGPKSPAQSSHEVLARLSMRAQSCPLELRWRH